MTKIILVSLLISSTVMAQGFTDLLPHKSQPANRISNPDNWMVIIGDSGSTGAASSLNIEPRIWNLLGHVTDFLLESKMTYQVPPLSNFKDPKRFNIDKVDPLTRVMYSKGEYDTAVRRDEVVDLNLSAKGSLKLDVHEHTNGYMIGRALGMKAEDIVLVGQDGVRVNSIKKQFERIYEMDTKTLPPLVLMSFVANDFCSEKIFTDPFEQLVRRFSDSLGNSLFESEPFLKAHPKGTRIVILGALDVANVLTNEDLMQQKVRFEGYGEISCRQIRTGNVDKTTLSKELAKGLSGSCKSVLQTKPTDKDRLDLIRKLQIVFNDVWKVKVYALNEKYNSKGIEFVYVEGTRRIQFANGDVANDCFHPGVRGHEKIADYVLKTVFKK